MYLKSFVNIPVVGWTVVRSAVVVVVAIVLAGVCCEIAVHLILHPGLVPKSHVLNSRMTKLVLLVIWPGTKLKLQVFLSKIVPSPSLIVKWSLSQSESWDCTLNAVNSSTSVIPCSTFIISVFRRLVG